MKKIVLLSLMTIVLVCCKQGNTTNQDAIDSITSVSADTVPESDEAQYGGLNEIRFANFDDKDWLDNDYIRALRKYLDDYNAGKEENEILDQYMDKTKGQFVIGNAEPFIMGGMFIQFIFIDSPSDMFSAWVYSYVDEDAGKVTGYSVREISLATDDSGFTKEEILELMEEHPELKLW